MATRTSGDENSKHARVSSPGFHAVLFRVTHDGLNERGTFYNVDRDCRCTPKWDSLRRCFLLQIQTDGDVSSLKVSQHLTCIDFYDPWELRSDPKKSVNLLQVYSLFFTASPIQSTPLLRYDTPRIQPPLIRSRYYVRNAKRVVASLRVSQVVVGENERRLYSQACAITSEKKYINGT